MNKFQFNNYLNSFDYISKLPVYSQKSLPKINKAHVSIKLRVISEYDVRIPNALLFSDWLTGQRGFVKSFKFIYKLNKPVIQIVIFTTLRRKLLMNFFDYISVCYFDILRARLASTRVSLFKSGFSFFIKDINFFYNVPNFLYNFNEQMHIKFFTKEDHTKEDLKLFLSTYPTISEYLKVKK